jgi:hypothetical protein
MAVSVEPAALREEATRWIGLADEMSAIRIRTESQLWLAPTAFFIGNLTEAVHYPAYRDFWHRMVTRLDGAAVEFELIATVLRRIADSYQETDQLSADEIDGLYTVNAEDLASATVVAGGGSRGEPSSRGDFVHT